MKLYTEITIQATPQQVWRCLTDFTSYPEWNPFIVNIQGIPLVGQQLSVQIGTMYFAPLVKECLKYQRLSWLGKLWFKGIFDGYHSFELRELENSTCLFIQQEHFKGILVPLLSKKLQTETLQGFHKMNVALKQRVEQ